MHPCRLGISTACSKFHASLSPGICCLLYLEYTVRCRLDFSGNEVYYTVIEPKGKRRYRTYVDHPWIIRAESDGRRMMLGSRMASVAISGRKRALLDLGIGCSVCRIPLLTSSSTCSILGRIYNTCAEAAEMQVAGLLVSLCVTNQHESP